MLLTVKVLTFSCRNNSNASSLPSSTLHQNGYAEYYADNMTTRPINTTNYQGNPSRTYIEHSGSPPVFISPPRTYVEQVGNPEVYSNPTVPPNPNISFHVVDQVDNMPLGNSATIVARTQNDPGYANPGSARTFRDNSGTLQIRVDGQHYGSSSDYGDLPLRPSTGDVIYSQPGM